MLKPSLLRLKVICFIFVFASLLLIDFIASIKAGFLLSLEFGMLSSCLQLVTVSLKMDNFCAISSSLNGLLKSSLKITSLTPFRLLSSNDFHLISC